MDRNFQGLVSSAVFLRLRNLWDRLVVHNSGESLTPLPDVELSHIAVSYSLWIWHHAFWITEGCSIARQKQTQKAWEIKTLQTRSFCRTEKKITSNHRALFPQKMSKLVETWMQSHMNPHLLHTFKKRIDVAKELVFRW